MSSDILICNKCNREAHNSPSGWHHCEDKSPVCEGARIVYPTGNVAGACCGKDRG